MTLALLLHLIAATLWVGGMFFALWIVRPSALNLELPLRVELWSGILTRFMVVVWACVITLPITGYWMIFSGFGGMTNVGRHIHVMEGLGWIMIIIFVVIFFRDFRAMRHMTRELLYPEAGLYIERLRKLVNINLILGLINVAVAGAGRYW
ncbi:MAG: CopD family protein [Magnetococcus sp. YQC-9]